ncbi:hypothetical protein F5148DRAFT_1282040 [Russula earlei]|uniref:Uncharacterized protein n=1 Tax=Russula earlei TaxID=71964 RepID=A0ACC0UFD2_9AGAM|nr:hypothetical protein F5148DRAFT_1282040 [Russula earlei]
MSHSVDSQSDGSETGLVAPDPPNPTLSSSFATYGCFPLPSLAYGSPCNVSQRFPSPHPRASSRSSLIPPPPAVPDGGGRFVYAGSYADVTQPAPTAVSKLVPEYMQPTTLPLSPDALLAPSFPLDHTSHTRHYNEADALHRKNMQNHYANPHAFGNQYQATSAVSTQFPKRPGSPPASAYYPAAWSSLEPPSHTQHDSWVFLNSDHVFSSSSSELQDNTVSGAPLPGPGSSGPPSQIASPALSQQGTSSTNLRAPREHRRATKRKRVDQPKDPRATPSLRHQRQSNGETITTQIARPALPQQGTSSMTLLDPHEHRCTRECKRVDQPKDPTATTRLRNQRQSDEAITKPQIASPALPNQGTSSTTLRAPHDRRPAPKRKRVDQPKDPKAANRLRKRRESDDRKLEEIFDIAVPSSVGKVPKKDRLDLSTSQSLRLYQMMNERCQFFNM